MTNPTPQKVKIGLSQFIEHLGNGLTWLKSEDVGYGSIQELIGANDDQINQIRQHPKLVGIEPTLVHFEIVDDLVEEPSFEIVDDTPPVHAPVIEQVVQQVAEHNPNLSPMEFGNAVHKAVFDKIAPEPTPVMPSMNITEEKPVFDFIGSL